MDALKLIVQVNQRPNLPYPPPLTLPTSQGQCPKLIKQTNNFVKKKTDQVRTNLEEEK